MSNKLFDITVLSDMKDKRMKKEMQIGKLCIVDQFKFNMRIYTDTCFAPLNLY